jgi:hypothetical protein
MMIRTRRADYEKLERSMDPIKIKYSSIYRYPRTYHLEGSNLGIGDPTKKYPIHTLHGKPIVIEEKVDGAQVGISFDEWGKMYLQSRGHYLVGGGREKYFDRFKAWAYQNQSKLWVLLKDQYIMYGEFMGAKHTIFYNNLPSVFLEFDIWDKRNEHFLCTERRKRLVGDFIHQVPVLSTGVCPTYFKIGHVDWSNYILHTTSHEDLKRECERAGSDYDLELGRTDMTGKMEGLYIKVEENGTVVERYKWVRQGFTQTVLECGDHWQSRKVVNNGVIDEA